MSIKRYFVILVCSVLVTTLFSRVLEKRFNPRYTAVFLKNRLHALFESMNRIARDPANTILVWGTSEIEGFFDPQIFQNMLKQQGLKYQVFNFGLRSAHPDTLFDFARGFRQRLPTSEKFAASIFKVPITRLTKSYTKFSEQDDRIPLKAATLTWRQVGLDFLENPQQGFSTTIEKTVWSWSSPTTAMTFVHDLPSFLTNTLLASPQGSPFLALWRNRVFLEKPEWLRERNGFYNFNRPWADEKYDEFALQRKTPEAQQWAISFFSQCCDVLNLEWDPERILELQKALKEISTFSKQVIIIITPDNPGLRAARTDAGKKNLAKLVQLLQETTGWSVITWEDQEALFSEFLYSDLIHINQLGWRIPMSTIAQIIKENHDRRD